VLAALHSTGWPDCVGPLNRLLTPITDGFIAVAKEHGRYLREVEGFPERKVFVIPNGVDVERFRPLPPDARLRQQLFLPPEAPVVGIVAALRAEKDHELFLRMAARVLRQAPACRFLIIGDGERRAELERLRQELGIGAAVHFLGTRSDVPELLALMDVAVLTSKMEANPVTILEAMACGKPFVAPRIGSISETIIDGVTGYLVQPHEEEGFSSAVLRLLQSPNVAKQFGAAARQRVVEHFSLERMVQGYQDLLLHLHQRKAAAPA
jgi:glycosyltransferase involved in cell wall biosynthesis